MSPKFHRSFKWPRRNRYVHTMYPFQRNLSLCVPNKTSLKKTDQIQVDTFIWQQVGMHTLLLKMAAYFFEGQWKKGPQNENAATNESSSMLQGFPSLLMTKCPITIFIRKYIHTYFSTTTHNTPCPFCQMGCVLCALLPVSK